MHGPSAAALAPPIRRQTRPPITEFAQPAEPGAIPSPLPGIPGYDTVEGTRKRCVEDHWTQAKIDCFVSAPDWTTSHHCPDVAATPPPEPPTISTTPPPAAPKSAFGLDCAKVASVIAASGRVNDDGGSPATTGFQAIEGAALPADSKYTKEYKSTLVIAGDRPGTIVRFPGMGYAYYKVDIATEPSQPPSAALLASYEALITEVAACVPTWSRGPTDKNEPLEADFRPADDSDDKTCHGGEGMTLRMCNRHKPSVSVEIATPTGRSLLRIRITISGS